MRTGIGRQIMLYLEKLALDAGLTQLSLESTLNAVKFYRAQGFVGDSVAKYVSPRGFSLDCIPMTKNLLKTETPPYTQFGDSNTEKSCNHWIG